MAIDTDRYRIKPGSQVDLAAIPTCHDAGVDTKAAQRGVKRESRRISDLQEILYAEQKHALLIVLQGMDASGKDSTVRHVFRYVNPAGCNVVSFKQPSERELRHDYLWRIHQEAPRRGHITIFNRSHYEDVIIVRVKKLVPDEVWRRRFDHINAFEKLLTDEGTAILKFWLHISKDYQKERLLRRLREPDKHWKFNVADLAERARWDGYQQAAAEAISRTSTESAPWYVIPAENRAARNLIVSTIIADRVAALDPKWPTLDFDPATVVIE